MANMDEYGEGRNAAEGVPVELKERQKERKTAKMKQCCYCLFLINHTSITSLTHNLTINKTGGAFILILIACGGQAMLGHEL